MGSPGAAPWRREMEMSITRAEFLRLLPVALGGIEFTCTGRGITALDGPCRIAIATWYGMAGASGGERSRARRQ